MASPLFASPEQIMNEKDELARKGIQFGRDVIAMEYADGIAFVAENASRTLNKVSEIYDRLALAAVGNIQEYDLMRMVGIEQAEVKGYTYSREDVTARWLANLYSQYIGNVWRQFDTKPLEVELLIAELGEPGYSSNRLYRVSYNGILADDEQLAVIGGKSKEIREWMDDRYESGLALTDVIRLGVQALNATREKTEDDESLTADKLEVATLNETRGRRKFERIARDDVSNLLDDSPSDD